MKKILLFIVETIFDELYGWVAIYYLELLVIFTLQNSQTRKLILNAISNYKSRQQQNKE